VNVNPDESIFDFELLGEVIEDGVTKLEVIAYTAPTIEVQSLRRLFVRSGFVMEGISIVPFAVQNFYRTGWTDIGEQNVCNLFIGRDWSRITIYSNNNLVLAREIKAGIRGIIESVRESVAEPGLESDGPALHAAGFSEEEINYFQQLEADATAETLITTVLRGEEVGEEPPLDLQDDRLFVLIQPAVERMVRQIERTIQHFGLNFENQTVNRVFVSGVLVAYPRIVDYIGSQLGLPVAVFDPFDSLSSIRPSIPTAVVERDAFVSSVGMALANNQRTPNFIHTFVDKQRAKSIRLVNRLVVGAFAAIMAVGIACYSWLNTGIEDKRMQVSNLKREAAAYPLSVTQDMILQAVVKIQKKNNRLTEYSQRYFSLALIREVSDLTPAEIRLVGIDLELGGDEASAGGGVAARRMILDGIVFGDRLTFDAGLGEYILRLKNSPLFERPTVKSKTFEFFENKEVLRFRVHLNLG
jgi:Tfp pilus assembly PilM family ATPase